MNWMTCKKDSLKEVTGKEEFNQDKLKINRRICFCGCESASPTVISYAGSQSVSYEQSTGGSSYSSCERITLEHSPRFERVEVKSLEGATVNYNKIANKVPRKHKDAVAITVVGEGTEVMEAIKFPTLIVKFRKTNWRRSKVYYVTLEVEARKFLCEIPAVLFSSHHSTKYAELLPLHIC